MSVVDNLARKNAERAVMDGLNEMAAIFPAPENWLNAATRHFMGALVGREEAPEFSAEQIAKAFDVTIEQHKYSTMPKPADVTSRAREFRPLPAYQKRHSDPTPERRWTDEERKRNLAFMDAINAKIEEQNADPEYIQAMRTHGRGSPELAAVVGRQRTELQAWINQNKPTN